MFLASYCGFYIWGWGFFGNSLGPLVLPNNLSFTPVVQHVGEHFLQITRFSGTQGCSAVQRAKT